MGRVPSHLGTCTVCTLVWYGLGECGASAQGEHGTGLPEVVRGWGMAGVELSVCEALAYIGKDGEKPADQWWVAFP